MTHTRGQWKRPELAEPGLAMCRPRRLRVELLLNESCRPRDTMTGRECQYVLFYL
jgi:hypothetical protein